MALNLSLRSLDTFALLLHSGPGAGKTHFMGDACFYEQQNGPVGYVNIKGQEGWLSLAEYEFGEQMHAETVETLDDFMECMADFQSMGMACNTVDSLRDLLRLCVINTTGTDRPPKVGGNNNNEYSQIYFDFERAIRVMKDSARRVITCSTSDRSTDQLTGKVNIVPDLPGRQGNGIAALFDFVGYMHASTNLGMSKRNLSFQTMTVSVSKTDEISILTRQRLARAITKDIVIPNGKGGWEAMLTVFQEHLVLKDDEKPETPKKKWGK